MMKIIINSKILVAIQFIIIFSLLFINDSIFNHSLSFFISTVGFLFGIYTLSCNHLGNFNITPEIKENSKLISNGAYKYIRHPMYFSVLMIMGGVVLTDINLLNIIFYLMLIIVLYLKANREEKLWSEKLKEYLEYKKNTKMFFPFIF